MLTLSRLGLFTCRNLPETKLSLFYSLNITPKSSICSLLQKNIQSFYIEHSRSSVIWSRFSFQVESVSFHSRNPKLLWALSIFNISWTPFQIHLLDFFFCSLLEMLTLSAQPKSNHIHSISSLKYPFPKHFSTSHQLTVCSTYFLHYSSCSTVLPMLL